MKDTGVYEGNFDCREDVERGYKVQLDGNKVYGLIIWKLSLVVGFLE